MSRTATATLQTPWDCKWSRFGRVHAAKANGPAEGLWVCVQEDGMTRRPIEGSQCETCVHWEYEPPLVSLANQRHAARIARRKSAAAACPHPTRTEKRIDFGVRVVALALAVISAAMGLAVLTRPLAIPLTISLWGVAVTSFLFGIWGRFDRRSLPERSW